MTHDVQRSRHERFLEWDEVELPDEVNLPVENLPQIEMQSGQRQEGPRAGLISRIARSLSGKRPLPTR